MSNLSYDLKKLYNEKKYDQIISIIEKIDDNNLNSGLINLLGVCKSLSSNSPKTLKSAISDFRKAFLREKKTENALHALKNFINVSVDVFDIEYRAEKTDIDNNIKEIFLYFNENKDYFEKNDELVRALVRALVRNKDISESINYLKIIVERNNSSVDALASLIYFNNYILDWDQKSFLDYGKKLDKRLTLYDPQKLKTVTGSDKKKIIVGIHSADIRSRHSITYFLKTILTTYDKKKFKIYLYCGNEKDDETTKDFSQYVDKTINIRKMSDLDVINLVREDKVDILIDMMGMSSNHRLSLYKNRLAPKQITWCGYCNTTGIKEMDYIVVDKNVVNQNEENLYSEKMLYLDSIWNCHSGYDFNRKINAAPFLKNKFITFGSFNNFNKINDKVIKVWSSILKEIKNSKLLLKSSTAFLRSAMIKKFEAEGVVNSVEFLSFNKSVEEHLNQYKKIDIALDTFPHNGVTTSFEAIWMGVPVIAMKGHNFISRSGESINKNLGLPELISTNEGDYLKKAIQLSNNPKKLLEYRDYIYANALNTPLFDKEQFSKQFFSALEKINK